MEICSVDGDDDDDENDDDDDDNDDDNDDDEDDFDDYLTLSRCSIFKKTNIRLFDLPLHFLLVIST